MVRSDTNPKHSQVWYAGALQRLSREPPQEPRKGRRKQRNRKGKTAQDAVEVKVHKDKVPAAARTLDTLTPKRDARTLDTLTPKREARTLDTLTPRLDARTLGTLEVMEGNVVASWLPRGWVMECPRAQYACPPNQARPRRERRVRVPGRQRRL